MIKICPMNKNNIDGVINVENESFDIPWSKASFESELKNKTAIYFVAVNSETENIVGYAGMWHVVNEGHITNIAVSKNYRKSGIGSMLIEKLIDVAKSKDMIGVTLEVRKSNIKAQNLYKKFGFIVDGIRREYYSDTKEDALIMWKYLIDKKYII